MPIDKPCYHHTRLSLHRGETCRLEDGFFFLLALNGQGHIAATTTKPEPTTLQAGDLCLLTPGMKSILYGPDTDTEAFELQRLKLTPAYFDSLSDSQPFYHQLAPFINTRTRPLLHLQDEDFNALQHTIDTFSDLTRFHLYRKGILRHLCSCLLLQTTDLLCRQPRPEGTDTYIRHTDELFRNFKKLIIDHYREQHRINFYASRLNITTTYLSRIVKSATGRTVRFHLAELLCADARKLLESSDMSIKGIAALLGFSNQSVFEKFFSTHTGMSPLKYRQKREHP
jgi:AraC family transcriptional activator of pobA